MGSGTREQALTCERTKRGGVELRKIGAVARELCISQRRIREYERAGLIRPVREANTGDRLFEARDVEQVRMIQRMIHEEGLTIPGIKRLLSSAPCWELTGCNAFERCAVARRPEVPCYEQRASGAHAPCPVECNRCPIYRAKDEECRPIVIRPTDN